MAPPDREPAPALVSRAGRCARPRGARAPRGVGPRDRSRRSGATRAVLVAMLLALLLGALLGGLATAVASGSSASDGAAPPPGAAAQGDGAEARTAELRRRTFDAVVDVFAAHYWEPAARDWSDWAAPYRSRALAARSRPAFDAVLRRMIADLDDDHSRWLGRSRDASPSVGAAPVPAFGVDATPLPGTGIVVERVFAATPAERAGLRRGDVIVAVDGRDLRPLEPAEARNRLDAAARQAPAELRVRRGRAIRRLRLEAAPRDAAAEQRPVGRTPTPRTGLVWVPSFGPPDVAAQVHRLVAGLAADGVENLILDLRGNPGGRITEMGLLLLAFVDGADPEPLARAVGRGTALWTAEGARIGDVATVVLRRPDGTEVTRASFGAATRFEGGLVVLVDEGSSSAGELAAAILQQRGRARIVGVPTDGNVEVVQRFDLPDGSAAMVAVAEMRAADGASFAAGIVPDALARADLPALARGYDAPVAEALRLLEMGVFRPGRYF